MKTKLAITLAALVAAMPAIAQSNTTQQPATSSSSANAERIGQAVAKAAQTISAKTDAATAEELKQIRERTMLSKLKAMGASMAQTMQAYVDNQNRNGGLRGKIDASHLQRMQDQLEASQKPVS